MNPEGPTQLGKTPPGGEFPGEQRITGPFLEKEFRPLAEKTGLNLSALLKDAFPKESSPANTIRELGKGLEGADLTRFMETAGKFTDINQWFELLGEKGADLLFRLAAKLGELSPKILVQLAKSFGLGSLVEKRE